MGEARRRTEKNPHDRDLWRAEESISRQQANREKERKAGVFANREFRRKSEKLGLKYNETIIGSRLINAKQRRLSKLKRILIQELANVGKSVAP